MNTGEASLPRSAFSTWSSSPPTSSTSDGDSSPDEIVYPLSRSNSNGSGALPAHHFRPQSASAFAPLANGQALQSSTSFTTAPVDPSADFPHCPSLSTSFADSVPPTLPRLPLRTSFVETLSNLLAEAPRTQEEHESLASVMPFPFLRRSASISHLPTLTPAGLPAPSSAPPKPTRLPTRSRFFANRRASASVNDLPDLLPVRPPPAATFDPVSQHGYAIGPRAGAKLLASAQAKRAMRQADELNEAESEEFSIRDRIAVREDGGLSTIAPSELTERPAAPQPAHTRTGSGSGSGSNKTRPTVRRVPVPPIDGRREDSIHELTRRASDEDAVLQKDRNGDAAKLRAVSLSKATSAGLGSPFSSPAERVQPPNGGVMFDREKKRRPPPISGLNRADEDRHTVSAVGSRSRSSSADSRVSVSMDVVLSQLGDAVRRERKKAEMYEQECQKAQEELEEIETNLAVLTEKFTTTLEKQELTIRNLQAELEEVEAELESANDLDEATAQEYLALLSSSSLDTTKPADLVTAFDPSALRSSSPPPSDPPPNPSKLSALSFKRGFNLRRRVDTHIAAYDTVASNVAVPKPPLERPAPPATPRSTETPPSRPTRPPPKNPRPRKLSRTRPFPSVTPSLASMPQPPVRSRQSDEPSPLDVKPRPGPGSAVRPRRPPPVSGVSRSKFIAGALGAASDSEPDEVGTGFSGRVRKRSNSFKTSLTGTMRILFPSNAPKYGPSDVDNERSIRHVHAWLSGKDVPVEPA
ncbi:hypothetical protein JCM1841_002140 [Sporobolomyces salmonicolor]